jgi:glutamyl-Q tRNA(Asp) synthetase
MTRRLGLPPAADGREGPDRAGIIDEASRKPSSSSYRYRISAPAVIRSGAGDEVEEEETGPHRNPADHAPLGDVVLARKDVPTSDHLAVTVDDAIQGVTLVTRGEDLATATHVHRVLQALLGLPTPRYRHHELVTDAAGRRLSKRDRALTIRSLRHSDINPAEIIARAALMGRGGRFRAENSR